ncbi:hypothetical protein IP81_06125 [Novosphingobium sp. AAP83]|uniref:helix-turn-helix domain-containing protein n=1 Tax=Novosphingobium sp. AAP83 TaxID=1523425 RepID=UPI0006B99A40|nr:helix-turn-helix domain-containing protein [Novosphingobium sp. AAP83]KPF92455.1 hypothetical protein IP81_06125 [Novosphingobium sp. AAP83]
MAEADGLNDITNVDSTPLPAGEPRLSGVAETLRAAREAAGLDIKQLAALTRVTSRHLIALEAGDYAALPGRPYALGFAKTYARAVGLDDKAITEAVRAELDQQAPAPAQRLLNQFEVGDPAKTPTRLTVWLAAGLVVAIVLAGFVFWRSYYLPSVDLPSLISDEPAAAAPSQVAVVPLPTPAPDGPVVFTAMEERIWVKFYDLQGQQILQKELALGESFTIPSGAQEPMLRTARPDALSITVGGQPVPRIAETEGLVKDVPVSAAALLARGTEPAPTASAAPAPTPVASAAPRRRPFAPRQQVAAPVDVPVADVAPALFEETLPASTGL